VIKRTVFAAGAAGLLIACGSRQQPATNASTQRDPGVVCAAKVGGARFEADDIPGGASLKMLTTTDAKVVAMRSFVRDKLQLSQARASGGVPMGQSAELPPVMTQAFDHEGGSLIRYTAINPADTQRVRDLVRWDAEMQNKGYCSRLISRSAGTSGLSETPVAQGGLPGGQDASRPPPFPLTLTGVDIDRSLVDACGIKATNAFFPFDSFDLRPTAYPLMNEVASCVTEGALAGRKLQVTGHADPRGSDEYNQKLGKDRAQSVADFLVSVGVHKDRIEVISRGEEGVSSDPHDWPRERRVDIRLAR